MATFRASSGGEEKKRKKHFQQLKVLNVKIKTLIETFCLALEQFTFGKTDFMSPPKGINKVVLSIYLSTYLNLNLFV